MAPRKRRPLASVVLAAGQGTRMKSTLPKVMHRLGELPLVCYPVQLAIDAGADPVVVVTGFGRELVESYLGERFGSHVVFAQQEEQLGTAHAVLQARSALRCFDGAVLILYGDVPLVPLESIRALRRAHGRKGGAPLALCTTVVDTPPAYGRILRDEQGRVVGVREARDCTPEELALREVNPGLYAVDAAFLWKSLARVGQTNAQGEFYLTDLIELASRRGEVRSVPVPFEDVTGVNDRADLARVDAQRMARQREEIMRSGVTMLAPETTWIGAAVRIGSDSTIGPQVVLRGETRLGTSCSVDAGAVLTDVRAGARCRIGAHSLLSAVKLPAGTLVPPGTVRQG